MVKASDVLGPDAEARVKDVKNWLKSKGVRDFEPVSLYCDQLSKVCPNRLISHVVFFFTFK